MKGDDKRKMCVQCDGRIPLDADACIFCGSRVDSLYEESSKQYKPPYPSRLSSLGVDEQSSPFRTVTAHSYSGLENVCEPEEQKAETKEIAAKSIWKNPLLWGTFALIVASHLIILGISLLCFSENGTMTLSWQLKHWYWYCLAALPCVYFGLKWLDKEEG